MLDLWRAQRAKRHAIAAIAPLIEGSRDRLGGIPATAWSDPYVTGLVAMLITRLAERHAGPMGDDALALVQAETWAALTGEGAESIGERLYALSSSGDGLFALGCRDGERVADAIGQAAAESPGLEDPEPWFAPSVAADVAGLWAACFESRLQGA